MQRLLLRGLLTLLAAASAASAQTGGDLGAEFFHMFNPSGWRGSAGHFLDASAPPELGRTMQIELVTDRTATVAHVWVGATATSGVRLPVGRHTITLHLDPSQLVGTFEVPVVDGRAKLRIPLPPDPRLEGVDLAWQAFVVNATGDIGATGLLVSNFGFAKGPARCDMWFQKHASANGTITDIQGDPEILFCNRAGTARHVEIEVQRGAGRGAIEFFDTPRGREEGAPPVASVPETATHAIVEITVPPGRAVFARTTDGPTALALKVAVRESETL